MSWQFNLYEILELSVMLAKRLGFGVTRAKTEPEIMLEDGTVCSTLDLLSNQLMETEAFAGWGWQARWYHYVDPKLVQVNFLPPDGVVDLGFHGCDTDHRKAIAIAALTTLALQASGIDDKGRCCGRKPLRYKRPRLHYVCIIGCGRTYDKDFQQIENWGWAKQDGVWVKRCSDKDAYGCQRCGRCGCVPPPQRTFGKGWDGRRVVDCCALHGKDAKHPLTGGTPPHG